MSVYKIRQGMIKVCTKKLIHHIFQHRSITPRHKSPQALRPSMPPFWVTKRKNTEKPSPMCVEDDEFKNDPVKNII